MPDALYTVEVKGQVRRPGSYRISSKDNLLDAIFRDAGGMAHERLGMKAVLVGGTTGKFSNETELKMAVGESTEVMVFDDGSCLVNVVELLLRYNDIVLKTCEDNAFCTAAVRESIEMLTKFRSGQGTLFMLERLKQLVATPGKDGGDALNPLRSALLHYESEFREHVGGGCCPASICGELMLSPCVNSCPANVDLPGTLAMMQMGKFQDALALGRQENPLFLTCGFVCEDPPCQKNCKRLAFDDAVYSQAMHRFAGEKAAQQAGSLAKALQHPTLAAGAETDKKIAVVGAGPAGLSAAFFLVRLGHKVTIYEKAPVAGGMAALGIPAYRIDKKVLAAEIESIKALGAEIVTNCSVGKDISLDELRQQNNAVLLAIGAGISRKLGISGEELPGVVGALEFLSTVAITGTAEIGDNVIVIGGGNVAMDAARTAKRLGAKRIQMLCIEDRFEMTASRHEIESAEEEEITMHGLVAPVSFEGAGRVNKVVYAPITPGPYDMSGRRWPPQIMFERTMEIDCDSVIVAIGQAPDINFVTDGLPRKGSFIANEQYMTSLSSVFTAGDCAAPVNTVVKAVKAGKEAAFIIDKYLTGSVRTLTSELRSQLGCFTGSYTCQTLPRVEMPEQDRVLRIANFELVELGLAEEQAYYEMMRCVCAAKGAL